MDKPGGAGRSRGRGRATSAQVPAGPARRPGQGVGEARGAARAAPVNPAWGPPASAMQQAGPSAGTLPSIRPSAPVTSQLVGRGTSHGTVPTEPSDIRGSGDAARGSMRGKRVIHEIIHTRPLNLNTKKGTTGREVALKANYFRVKKSPSWNVYQYRVDFSPDIDLARVRRGVLSEHRDLFKGYIFDGTVLFTTQTLQQNPLELVTKNREGEPIKITIKHVGVVQMTDGQYMQVLNLVLRRSMEGLNLQLVGRNFFDALAKVDLRDYKLELWPGYTTSIRQHEADILLCAEIAHKVMRTDTLYDILKRTIQESRNYQETYKKDVMGMIVLTDYNNKTYRIDDIDFNSSPRTTFDTKNGPVSFIDYYKTRYNIIIRDADQPLLVSRSTERNIRSGQSDLIMLIPELARATGLNDTMRNNFQLMRAMSDHTRLAPNARIDRLKVFNRRLQSTRQSMDVLESWQLQLDPNLVELKGRLLAPERILFGNNRVASGGEQADWQREFRNNSMFNSENLSRWYVITPTRCQREANEFVKAIKQASNGMQYKVGEPRSIVLQDDRNGSYVGAIEKACMEDPQLLMLIVPNINAERYSVIKKKCCVDRAIPSQVIVHKTISPRPGKPSGLMSVATKVAIQMNAKLKGAPWMIDLPLTGLMTVGFDVCHSARDASKSFGALVATMDLKKSSEFYSSVTQHMKGQELSQEIGLTITKALQQYREMHNALPSRIIFYRDGVGDGQLHQVVDNEVVYLKEKLDSIYKSANIEEGCKFAYVIVSKRINTRYFLNNNNPPPGTVVDDVITLPERYDFYLVSQSVRQGTVSPTSYNIIHDTLGLNADKLQILSYKFCHLYYNWSGTTRVPAMCQYAHKLAFLVAQSIHQSPSVKLEKQLYFL